jgi:hypothetical protein
MGAAMTKYIRMPIWVIYANPLDYPGQYVARLWDGMTNTATTSYMLAPTLEAIRRRLPPDLCCLDRQERDAPCIVETWL